MWRTLAYLRIREIQKNLSNVEVTQKKILTRILSQLQGCQLAQRFGLHSNASVDLFRKIVPITEYDFYRPYVQAILDGEQSIMFAGTPVCIAKTGGSTAEPKLIPLGREVVRSYRQFNLDMAFCYMRDSSHYDIFSDRMLVVVASPEEKDILPGVPLGRATSVMARIAPSLLRKRYIPNMEVLLERDISEKIRQTTLQILENQEHIRMAAGLTPYLLNAFNNLLTETRQKNLSVERLADILPKLRVIFHGGTTFDLYSNAIRRLTGNTIEHRNIYSAAEGPIAFQSSAASTGLLPAIDHVFFEFLPVGSDTNEDMRSFLLHEIECDTPYYILLTTQGGLLRYKIGDQVKFIQKNPPLMKVLGRAEDQIDLSGEKMTVDEAVGAITHLDLTYNLEVTDFVVCPLAWQQDRTKIAHEWIIECEKRPADSENFRKSLENELHKRNERYRDLRLEILEDPKITFVPKGTFQRYAENNLVYGQQKMLHMHNDRAIADSILDHA
jgi:hypothetical protein